MVGGATCYDYVLAYTKQTCLQRITEHIIYPSWH